MKKIEGIRLVLEFGHYESDEEGSWLMPDYSRQSEISLTSEFDLKKLESYKKEAHCLLDEKFDRFEKEYDYAKQHRKR